MRLLQLKSSNPNFKTITFEAGLNIVAGLQLSKEDKESINGIGKSLSLILIHLIFGSKLDNKKPKERKLKDFLSNYGEFYLNFFHNSIEYEIKKDFSKTDYYINDKKITQKDYPSELTKIFFGENSTISFKQVFNCFARRFGGDYYSDPLRQQGQPLNDYYQRLTNLKLLHIDIELVQEKFKVEEELSKLNKAKEVIKDYQKAVDSTNLKDLEDEYKMLVNDKKNFVIAENYNILKVEADTLTNNLNELRNEIQSLRSKLQKKKFNIESSENIDIDPFEIENLYNETKFFFDDKITKRLEDAQKFHNTLIQNRKNRLEIEIKELQIIKDELTEKMSSLSTQRDDILKRLDSSGALEEYNSIEERISFLKDEIKKLTKYEETLIDFKLEESQLTTKSAQINEKSLLYIEKNKQFLEEIENKFRDIVKKFYNNHGGSLKLKDTKKAKYLYDIALEIPRGSSQAIGEVEIFCYDVLLYKLNEDLLNFMAHDGYIFSEMDPRQKAMIFKIVLEMTKNANFQYFINIGENSLKEVLEQDILTDEEKKVITNSIRLELYDKNPKNWLFGQAFS